jgi:hypothetical protein
MANTRRLSVSKRLLTAGKPGREIFDCGRHKARDWDARATQEGLREDGQICLVISNTANVCED